MVLALYIVLLTKNMQEQNGIAMNKIAKSSAQKLENAIIVWTSKLLQSV